MKTYYGPQQLRMVGKAWEIRASLRRWAGSTMTLQELLTRVDRATRRSR